jgi:hypothetical protein
MNMYLLLYSGGDMPTTDEENDSMMNAWRLWLGDIGDALVDGNPFHPEHEACLAGRRGCRWPGGPDGVGLLPDQDRVDG